MNARQTTIEQLTETLRHLRDIAPHLELEVRVTDYANAAYQCRLRLTREGALLDGPEGDQPVERIADPLAIALQIRDSAAEARYAESVDRRWSEKMHPLQYQRPQAPPSAGNVKRAEELFAELGLAPALRRRYARLDDLQKLWVPQGYTRTAPLTGVSASPGVFAHVAVKDTGRTSFKPSTAQPTSGSAKMTLVKFRRDVLPGAAQIELVVPKQPAAWSALVTAVDPEAPPLLQWDRPDSRNTVSWYLYTDGPGRDAASWGLIELVRLPVSALVLAPNLWRDEADPAAQHHGRKLFVIVEGCRDMIYERGGGFFPSMLRGELREVRATLVAHVATAKIESVDVPACGLMLPDDPKLTWDCELWVTDRHGVVSRYVLDRWE